MDELLNNCGGLLLFRLNAAISDDGQVVPLPGAAGPLALLPIVLAHPP